MACSPCSYYRPPTVFQEHRQPQLAFADLSDEAVRGAFLALSQESRQQLEPLKVRGMCSARLTCRGGG